MIHDDAIREQHGIRCREGRNNELSSILIWETERTIHIDSNREFRTLTRWEARYLASKLYRLSRRTRHREEALTTNETETNEKETK